MDQLSRLRAIADRFRSSLWLLPAAAVLLAVTMATVLVTDAGSYRVPESVLFVGDLDAARGLLEVLAGSTITVTGLVFTLTVVALQIASGQYSPRLVGSFLRDRGNKVVLSAFLATFAYALAALRSLPAGDGAEVPRLAITVGMVLALASLLSLVYFIDHLAQSIRVETILARSRRRVMQTIEETLPHPLREDETETQQPTPPHGATRVRARHSGYVNALSTAALLGPAVDAGAIVRLRVAVGDIVAEGATLAWVWRQHADISDAEEETLADAVHDAVEVGPERSYRQDITFGLRQIVDVAVRALSPGVNDPATAVDAIGQLTEPLIALAERHIGTRVQIDEDGVVRVSAPTREFEEYLELACGQPRRYGAGEPVVLAALARMLGDVAEAASSATRREAIRTQLEVLLADARRVIDQPRDRAMVERAVGDVTRS